MEIRRVKMYLSSMLNMRTLPLVILGMFFVMNFAFAETTGIQGLQTIFMGLACDIKSLLIPIGFLLVVAASVIYAGGQIGSAEMRGKSQGWATWALVGAIVAFVIAMLGPALIEAMYETSGNFPTCCATEGGVSGCSLETAGGLTSPCVAC